MKTLTPARTYISETVCITANLQIKVTYIAVFVLRVLEHAFEIAESYSLLGRMLKLSEILGSDFERYKI